MHTYSWLNFYRAATLPDSTKRNVYFGMMSINIGVNRYVKEFTDIDIKKQIKNKDEVNYSNFIPGQIRAYFFWKKSKSPKKDIFDGFIPYGNHTFWEADPENFMKDNDMELLRTGKLSEAFYNFNISIPIITVE